MRRQRQLLAENMLMTSGNDNGGGSDDRLYFSSSMLNPHADTLIALDEYSPEVVNDLAKSVAHSSDEGLKWTNIYGAESCESYLRSTCADLYP
ncbi:hypothetical protein GUITHDRAFT_116365 [Guillardia theta CCMP2712]|uniref:Uncharacterized protein n=1 Tax=Guillardia theta (strain CCMP2712) TaxID=905079 RepID=L1IMS5_GUITC|nr:hypothetical protein GUITHDRAFT_116365 [Guillardia theta CCMP2712]EKX37558.1 hypothetical protein GUITHDRAFT_116365 [Guillardia theta CCMP2712]|eukprot:XP_005824538.1 hypothetical protein GUITHDRAFT_116365 [Guillardia theta CCMP2712]